MAGLPLELLRVAEVLILTSSAVAKEMALGLDPVGGSFEDLDEIGVRAVAFITPDAGGDFFTRESKWNEDDPVIGFGDSGSEIGEGKDFQFDDFVELVRIGLELFGR